MVSKGLYHNFYGALTGAPVPGPGIPSPEGGDLYYDTILDILFYWNPTLSAWVAVATSGVDIRESKYIVGNTVNGDVAGVNVDFVNGAGLYSALLAMAAAAVPSGRIYIREGLYAGAQGPPAPIPTVTYANYQLSDPAFAALNGHLVIQGAGKDCCKFVNTGANPVMVLDHPNGSPVTLWGITIEGSGLVNGTTTGMATIEIGRSGANPTMVPPQLPLAANGVTLQGVNVPAQGDFSCICLVNDGVNGAVDFTAVDCVFSDANAGVLASGCVNIGPNAVGFATNINFSRCQFNACKGNNGSGVKGNSIMGAVFDACNATGNKNAGYRFELTANINMSNCQAMNNSLASVGVTGGFAFIGSESATLTGCIATTNGKAAAAGGDNFIFNTSNRCTLSSCIVDGGADGTPSNGFNFNASNYCIADGCIAKACMSTGPSLVMGNGFIISGASSYCQINDCHANSCFNFGAYLGSATVRCEIVAGTYINNTGSLAGPYTPNVYDAVGAGTTNELAHFQYL